MISDQDRHWLSHHLQSLITRIQADVYLMEHKLSKSADATHERERYKASLKELSEILRAYFDAQTLRTETVKEVKRNIWLREIRTMAAQKRQSAEPLANEVADFLDTLVASVTQP